MNRQPETVADVTASLMASAMTEESAAPGCLDTGAAGQAGGTRPTLPAQVLAWASAARQWRETKGHTRKALAAICGWSEESICDMETGHRHAGKDARYYAVRANVYRRYALTLAGLDSDKKPPF